MKTIRKFSLVLLSMVLLFTLTSCDETGAVSVDTAKVEKSVLSVMNTALGTDFTNDESLRSKADYIWDKVDENGRIFWTQSIYYPEGKIPADRIYGRRAKKIRKPVQRAACTGQAENWTS